jgi:hypothetical protein
VVQGQAVRRPKGRLQDQDQMGAGTGAAGAGGGVDDSRRIARRIVGNRTVREVPRHDGGCHVSGWEQGQWILSTPDKPASWRGKTEFTKDGTVGDDFLVRPWVPKSPTLIVWRVTNEYALRRVREGGENADPSVGGRTRGSQKGAEGIGQACNHRIAQRG